MTVWLLLVVAVTNLASDPIAQVMGWQAQKVFYVLRGVEGTLVFWLLTAVAPRAFRYVWLIICSWAMAESLMTSACGSLDIMWPMRPRYYEGLCDIHTGLPLYWSSMMLASGICVSLILGAKSERA